MGLSMTMSLILCCTFLGQAEPWVIDQDLRKRQDLVPGLRLSGPDVVELANPEPEGLRFTVPADRQKGPVGLQADSPVSGDFEITGGYEILAADKPAKRHGVVGVNLYIVQGADGNRFAKIGNYHTPLHEQAYGIQHTVRNRVPSTVMEYFPTEERTGEIRLSRKGKILSFLVKDQTTGNEFKEIVKCDFGEDDLTLVRFVVNTSEEPCAVDARLIGLRISGGPTANPAADSPSRPGPLVWLAAAIVGCLFLAGLVGVWRWRRVRRDEAAAMAESEEAASASDGMDQEQTSAGGIIEIRCPSCRKRLRLSGRLLGKKVKCPGCACSIEAAAT